MSATRMLQRRGTAAAWASINPVLDDGEIGYARDTNIIKIGDGVTHWNDLPGNPGPIGPTGVQGPIGPQGNAGVAGTTGPQGIAGGVSLLTTIRAVGLTSLGSPSVLTAVSCNASTDEGSPVTGPFIVSIAATGGKKYRIEGMVGLTSTVDNANIGAQLSPGGTAGAQLLSPISSGFETIIDLAKNSLYYHLCFQGNIWVAVGGTLSYTLKLRALPPSSGTNTISITALSYMSMEAIA